MGSNRAPPFAGISTRNRLDRRKLDAAIGEIEHITHVDARIGVPANS